MTRIIQALAFAGLLTLSSPAAVAGNQMYEPLSASVQAALNKANSDQAVPYLAFNTQEEARSWLGAMSKRLAKRMPDRIAREEFLVTVHYEAKRAGLETVAVKSIAAIVELFDGAT